MARCDSHSRILDFTRCPLRLGGLSTADDGLFDFDINSGDDIIKAEGGNTDIWVDDYVQSKWGSLASQVPYIGRFTHFAITANGSAANSAEPHLWDIAASDWYLDIETDSVKYKQEVRAGLGLPKVPQVSGFAAFDSDQATQTEVARVAGFPTIQAFKEGPLVVDFETAVRFALACTAASNNSTSFSANVNVTLYLFGHLGRNSQVGPDELEKMGGQAFQGRTIGAY
jgi:hypothetical protein